MAAKLLFINHPELTPWHILTYRSIISSCITVLLLNKNLKKSLYDELPTECIPALAARCVQITLSIQVNYSAIYYFPLTYVNMFQNISPMVVVVLCYLIYNETMSNQEIIALVLAFFAVTMTIMGGYQGQSANSSTAGLIMLILNPFVIASGQLLMRKLKKLHESIVSAYSNFS